MCSWGFGEGYTFSNFGIKYPSPKLGGYRLNHLIVEFTVIVPLDNYPGYL